MSESTRTPVRQPNPVTQNNDTALPPGTTIGQAKELWSEVLFYLALFFGLLHFAGLVLQVVAMFMHTTLRRELDWVFTSSLLMSNLYLAFLTAYVGGKEFVRWFKRRDDEVISVTEAKKISRGVWIVMVWAVFTGVVVFIWQMNLITEVPNTLLYTLGEVVALFCGTEASKYIRNQQVAQSKQDKEAQANYAERVKTYCQEQGSITSGDCQREYGLDKDQANRLLNKLVKDKVLRAEGTTKARKYFRV